MPTAQNIPQAAQSAPISRPLVSFIVTAYNIPAMMLRQCVGSILALPLKREEREVIVVDDGSDEPVAKRLENLQGSVACIRQQNQGVSVARNVGMAHASGQYIQFVDGDDCLLQAPYERCLGFLRLHRQTDMVVFRTTSNANAPKLADFKGPVTGAEFMTANNLHGAVHGYLFKKDILKGLQFAKGITYGEDELFTPQLIVNSTCLYSTETQAYYYRQRNGSVIHQKTNADKDKRIGDTLNVIAQLQAVQKSLDDEGKREALDRRINQLAMDCLYNVARLTKSRSRLNQAKHALAKQGLYPLPDKRYTLKYSLFRKII